MEKDTLKNILISMLQPEEYESKVKLYCPPTQFNVVKYKKL